MGMEVPGSAPDRAASSVVLARSERSWNGVGSCAPASSGTGISGRSRAVYTLERALPAIQRSDLASPVRDRYNRLHAQRVLGGARPRLVAAAAAAAGGGRGGH